MYLYIFFLLICYDFLNVFLHCISLTYYFPTYEKHDALLFVLNKPRTDIKHLRAASSKSSQ